MNDRPSDEMTGKVVAKKEGWDKYFYLNQEDDKGKYWDFDYDLGPYRYPLFHTDRRDGAGDLCGFVADPRDNTDSALELAGYVCRKIGYNPRWGYDCWTIKQRHDDGNGAVIPLSGPAFRYAVVNLAIKVMGLEEDKEVQS